MEHDKVLGHGTGVQVLGWGKEGKGTKEPQQGLQAYSRLLRSIYFDNGTAGLIHNQSPWPVVLDERSSNPL